MKNGRTGRPFWLEGRAAERLRRQRCLSERLPWSLPCCWLRGCAWPWSDLMLLPCWSRPPPDWLCWLEPPLGVSLLFCPPCWPWLPPDWLCCLLAPCEALLPCWPLWVWV